MKKILLLIAMVVTSYNVFAFATQGVWRWRKDDGSETSATWKAAQNTPITIYSVDSIQRLRIELYDNSSTDNAGLTDAFFEYTTDNPHSGSAKWIKINLADSNAFQFAGSSPFVSDLTPTTHQLNGQAIPPYSFVAGKVLVATDTIPKQDLTPAQTTEFEYVFRPTANILSGKTYSFRVDAAVYPVGYVYPSLTTAAVLPVNISSFKVEADKNQALITWTTATEQNNSRFDIERSSDGKNYTVIATVKGNGTTSLSHSYQAVDSKPLNGVNYYRIKQIDVDGKYQISDIRSLKFVLQNALVNVYPNPTHGDINFTLQNYQGTLLKAVLTDVSGKIVHEESINVNTSGAYKLNLNTKLSAGIYMLKLDGNSLSEKMKIVVQ